MGIPGIRLSCTLLAAAALAPAGCTIESPLSVRRVWADYNTLRAPAVYYEVTSRVPMDSARVRELRWRYNAGPDSDGNVVPASKPGNSVATKSTAPLPPHPGKLDAPATAAPEKKPQPPDLRRSADARDEWRFIH